MFKQTPTIKNTRPATRQIKLKLCSCRTENVQRLKHYWVLNRPEDKDEFILGEIVPPANIGERVEKYNINSLRKQLNNGNCFDVDLVH